MNLGLVTRNAWPCLSILVGFGMRITGNGYVASRKYVCAHTLVMNLIMIFVTKSDDCCWYAHIILSIVVIKLHVKDIRYLVMRLLHLLSWHFHVI
jgi:hypothetical protein